MYFFRCPELNLKDSFNKICTLKPFKEEIIALDTKKRQDGNLGKVDLAYLPPIPNTEIINFIYLYS